jgi:hypothetical protein
MPGFLLFNPFVSLAKQSNGILRYCDLNPPQSFLGYLARGMVRFHTDILKHRLLLLLLFVVYLTTLFQYLRLYNVDFYSILIRLPSSSEAGETRVRNMAAEFCRRAPLVLVEFFNMP